MAERLTAEQAKKLENRSAAADRAVNEMRKRLEAKMADREEVFLDCFDSGLTIPEIAVAAGKSPAMVSIALSRARKRRDEGQRPLPAA